jgi:asparagine synthase (glutamine-hydrolysing)
MTDEMAHRGPDGAGMLVLPPVVLGNRRLSILDLSPAAHQPMGSEDGDVWLTYNGEIYNYKELAQDLRTRGHRFRSSGDTDVLLRAYVEWGPDCLTRLNGMFAFAVWDRRRQELFCVRDRLGVKPFYYTVVGGRFRFASEIKALLLDPEVQRKPNDARVFDFLARGLADHTEETMFEGIYQLPPGSCMCVSPTRGVARPTLWYRLQPADLDGQPASEVVRELLTDSVSLRLRSDVPVGTLLSGGLDSSSVTAIATRLRRAEGADPPASFTARSRDPRIDEGRYVKAMLEVTGSRNHEFLPDDRHLLDELDLLLWHMDEPFGAASLYGHWKLMELARNAGITVVLDGSGGDEAFVGYHFLLYPSVYFTLCRGGRLLEIVQELAWRRRRNGVSLQRSASEALRLSLPHRARAFRRPPWIHPKLPIPRRPLPPRTLRGHQLFGLTASPLPMHNHADDRSPMSFSLEMRNPFLDYRIVECGLSLESRDLLHHGLSKWVLREAMRGVLPPAIVDRPDKQGFTTDEVDWLRRGELGSEIEAMFRSKTAAARPYFRPDALLAMLASHRAGQQLEFALWRAFTVERWLRLFIDPAVYQAPVTPSPAVRAGDHVTRLEEERSTTSSLIVSRSRLSISRSSTPPSLSGGSCEEGRDGE